MSTVKTLYRRNLPHIQPQGNIIFLTYRLAGSLPRETVKDLRRERKAREAALFQKEMCISKRSELRAQIRRRSFLKNETLLQNAETGPTWLGENAVAGIVNEAIRYRHPSEYHLICFTIMPNHVHQIIINHRGDMPLYQTMKRLKSYTATKANRILGRTGTFWQRESFDHVIRNGKLEDTIRYVLENPTVAGLVDHWRDWPHSWLNPEYDTTP